jgi:RsiW-degrading membrane proteinase PrsW (M82 family)
MPGATSRNFNIFAPFWPPSFRASGIRRFLLPLLLLALLPLTLFVSHDQPTFDDKIARTIAAHPEDPGLPIRIAKAREDQALFQDFFPLLPDHRLQGAILPYESNLHWLLALGAAVVFLALAACAIPRTTRIPKLTVIAFFTATIGICLLLFFQINAESAADSNQWVISCGPSTLLYILVKFIGYSYSAADNPHNGFLLSFLGYTFGVGLCEELTKAIPPLIAARKSAGIHASPNKLLLWGLASGIGFGISEAINYAGNQYNGICGADTYLVRYVSCVTLHAIWAGTVSLLIHSRQLWLQTTVHSWDYCFQVLLILLAPMTLHGLYDTLLKGHHDLLAFLTALASLLFFAYLLKLALPSPVKTPDPKPLPTDY